MAEPYRCLQCERDESKCICEKYCSLCMGGFDVRLVQDGMYYCRDCREACDFSAQV
jgi:hypothetical protein